MFSTLWCRRDVLGALAPATQNAVHCIDWAEARGLPGFGSAPLPHLPFQVANPQIPTPACYSRAGFCSSTLYLAGTPKLVETGDGGGSEILDSDGDDLSIGLAHAM